jgi:hypothetical protein
MLASSPTARRVLCLSVLYRGCAIPVAWSVVSACGEGAEHPIWLDLFDLLADSVPSSWTVLMFADRGMAARWLYQHIQRLGWHPFMGLDQGAKRVRRLWTAITGWPPLLRCQATGGVDKVRCITLASSRLDCTLVACWDEQHEECWFIVTDLLPAQADTA